MKSYSHIGRFIISVMFILFVALMNSCKEDEPTDHVDISELLKTGTSIDVTKNPNGITPLCAEMSFETKFAVKVDLEVKGNLPVLKSWSTYSKSHTVPVIGLYPGRENEITLTLSCEDGRYAEKNFVIVTDSLPAYFPQVNIQQDNMTEDAMFMTTMVYADNPYPRLEPFIFDRQGNIRWWMDLSEFESNGNMAERMENGNTVIVNDNRIMEYSMTGELVNDLTIPGYKFHNGITVLPNDNYACLATKVGATILHNDAEVNSVKDHFLEIERNSGTILQEWNLQDVLDVNRNDVAYSEGDWLHLNAISYWISDDTYVLSGRNQGVIKIGRSNDLHWILAPHYNWGNSGSDASGFPTMPYLLTAVDASGQAYNDNVQLGYQTSSNFEWPWGQHASTLLDNGNIVVFDNGMNRGFEDEDPKYSRAVEYAVNESDTTVQQVWEYGKDRGDEFYSPFGGDVDVLDNGNRLITSGTINYTNSHYATIVEITYPGNTAAFEANLYFQDIDGNNTGAPETSDMIYRAEKISLYPEGE
ncbi:MAG: aryl-sulfate sulfotransferase [Bacteroidota bacterium]|nr:aryl-sulfate sulfotransferase [Bacteroidota bacterium]